ncbi:MAG TPA: BON domain-containing protein [Burkholderiales bacterium]|nr:BON domain-containing protein [Burkholderiales bacterium]
MKTMSKLAGAMLAAVLVAGAAGCASDSDRRGISDTGAVASDSWITTKVKSDLLADKQVSSTHIHVKTVDGVVTLSGSTDSQADIDRAIQDANSVKGVKSVVNELEVKS